MSSSKQASGLQHQQVVRQLQAAPAAVLSQVVQMKSPADIGPCCSTDIRPHIAITLAQWDGVDRHPGHVLVRWVQLSRYVCCCCLKLVTQAACMLVTEAECARAWHKHCRLKLQVQRLPLAQSSMAL